MESLIYKHHLYDAWMRDMFSIEVHDTKEHNIVCTFFGMSPFDKGLPMLKRYTVSEATLEQIKQILSKNSELLYIDGYDVHEPYMVLDGVINCFTYKLENNRNKVEISNIAFFEKYEGYVGNQILEVHHEIVAILRKEGVDKRFLSLD